MHRLLHLPVALCALPAILLLACAAPNPAYEGRIQAADALVEPPAADAIPAPVDAAAERPAPDAAPVDAVGRDTTPPPDAPPIPPDAAPTPPVMDLALDEGMGSATVGDSSGSGYTGTLVNMDPQTSWVPGRKGGSALFFNPTTASPHPGVKIAATGALAGLQQFTLAAWVYITATTVPNQMTVVSQGLDDGTQFEVFNLNFVNGRLNFILPGNIGSTNYNARAPDLAPTGTWLHVAATFDGKQGCLYQNGALAKTVTFTLPLPVSKQPIYVGTNINPTNEQPFVGYIDDVLIYRVPLSASEIAALARP